MTTLRTESDSSIQSGEQVGVPQPVARKAYRDPSCAFTNTTPRATAAGETARVPTVAFQIGAHVGWPQPIAGKTASSPESVVTYTSPSLTAGVDPAIV